MATVYKSGKANLDAVAMQKSGKQSDAQNKVTEGMPKMAAPSMKGKHSNGSLKAKASMPVAKKMKK